MALSDLLVAGAVAAAGYVLLREVDGGGDSPGNVSQRVSQPDTASQSNPAETVSTIQQISRQQQSEGRNVTVGADPSGEELGAGAQSRSAATAPTFGTELEDGSMVGIRIEDQRGEEPLNEPTDTFGPGGSII